jgi:Tfp pilus assembly protein PilX
VYGPVSFTPTAPGVYHWKASYSGDPPNTLSTDTNSDCTDSNEDVTVRQIPTIIATDQKVFPNDSATITSSVAGDNLPAGGTVVFRLYGPTAGATALVNCQAHGDTVGSGGLLYKETANNVGGTHSVTVGTNNTTVSVNTNDTFFWRVTYDTGDTAHTGRQSDCAENVSTAFVNDAGPGTVFP